MRAGELGPQTARYIAHSRDSSLETLQSAASIAKSSSRSRSPVRAHPSASRSAAESFFERVVNPRTASSYGHHRQTSIVHGIQHSRNGSHASTSSSPLSPEIIAAAGAGLAPDRSDMHPYGRADGDSLVGSRPPTAMSGSTLTSGQLPERTSSATEASTSNQTQRKVERMHSGRRRDHAHHHSHSRHHKDDQKTVGEYALHVLFTSVGSAMRPVLRAHAYLGTYSL